MTISKSHPMPYLSRWALARDGLRCLTYEQIADLKRNIRFVESRFGGYLVTIRRRRCIATFSGKTRPDGVNARP